MRALVSDRGGDVAGHELDLGILLADYGRHGVEDTLGVTVGGVDADDVGLSLYQSLDSVGGVLGDTHGGAYAQPAQFVLAGVGELDDLHDVFDGDEAAQLEVVVHHQELLDLVDLELVTIAWSRVVPTGTVTRFSEVMSCCDGLGEVGLEAGVAVGDDAGQRAVGIDDGYAGDVVFLHEGLGVAVRGGEGEGDGVHDHPRLTPLDLAHHLGLPLDGLVLVDDCQPAFPGQRDGERRLGHGVHGSREQGDIEADLPCEPGADVGLFGQDPGFCRDQEDVVEAKALTGELLVPIDHARPPFLGDSSRNDERLHTRFC